MTPLTFAIEPFATAFPQAKALLEAHWEEIAPYKDLFRLNPDVNFYLRAEEKGALHIITAREGEALVGYMVMILAPHVHYRDVLVATDDIHFLAKPWRRHWKAQVKAAETLMAAKGAKVMVLRTKADHNHGVLFERIGYKMQDIVYTRRLGD